MLNQLRAEVNLVLANLRLYWVNNLVGLFVDVVYFYAILVAVRAVVQDALPNTSSLVLIYAALQLFLGFYVSIAFILREDAVQGTLEHLALARGGLVRQVLLRAGVLGALVLIQTSLILTVLLLLTGQRLTFAPWWPLGLIPLVIAALGLSLAMGALALYFRQISSFYTLVQFLLIPYFLSFTQWQPYMVYLPLAPTAHAMRLSLSGQPVPLDVYLVAFLQGLLLLLLGSFLLLRLYALVRRRGLLGRY
jgi:ABC-2 type transport system permease protein